MLRAWISTFTLSFSLLINGSNDAQGQEIWADTYLLDAYVGSHRSSAANALSKGGYELSGGVFIDFRDWYRPKFPDTTVLLLKQISPDFGIIWGVSTGERGKKYRIAPAWHLGFVYNYSPFQNAAFSVKAVYPIFGRMSEKACVADYGVLGGIQIVNCRLAADITPPEQTLRYLLDLKGYTDAWISISFSLEF